jgi:beta-carotene ketolase (CrtW type)
MTANTAHRRPIDRRARERVWQTAVGLSLAALIVGAWTAVEVTALLVIDWSRAPLWLGAAAIFLATWLFVGLFIVAHDCMHGSLAPGRPWLNRAVGRLVLALYVAFSYDRLLPDHHRHHRRPGTADDPDYHPDLPDRFWPWFGRFMRHYFTWRQFFVMGAVFVSLVGVFGVHPLAILVFYALPAILSALQLFYFGTFRPHRLEAAGFADDHRSRTDDFPFLVSLFTCFHFGYHHEHHLTPTVPWWRLPAARRARRDPAATAVMTKT